MESQHDELFFAEAAPPPVAAQPEEEARSAGSARPKKRRLDGKASFVEGTAVGDGTRLVRVLLADLRCEMLATSRHKTMKD